MSSVWSDGDGRGSDFYYVCDSLLRGSGVVEGNGTNDNEENETNCVFSYCYEGSALSMEKKNGDLYS